MNFIFQLIGLGIGSLIVGGLLGLWYAYTHAQAGHETENGFVEDET